MEHLGDITKISGYDAPTVDIICGGSPCQDLSVAGKRAGLDGERSGLFMEQVRIVKEMRRKDEEQQRDRRADKYIRPRFMVWENVQGAFSSPGKRNGEDHRGEDFQAVLTEIARIAKSNCPIVPLPKDRKWPHSGCIMGIGDNGQPFSIAYRLHDAQFWGVPQRRKRISLVADFGGCTASDILFEKLLAVKQGLSRDIKESRETREGTTRSVEESTRKTSGFPLGFRAENTRLYDETATTLCNGTRPGYTCGVVEESTRVADKTFDVRISSDGTKNWRAHCYETDICRALDTGGEDPDSNHGGVTVVQSYSIDQGAGKSSCSVLEDKSPTLATTHDGAPAVYNISAYESNAMKSSNPHSGIYEAKTSRTLDLNGGNPNCNQGGSMVVEDGSIYSIGHDFRSSKFTDDEITDPLTASDYKDPIKVSYYKQTYQNITGTLDCGIVKGTGNQLANQNMFIANQYVVRRLTPLECERLQGYPDGWTNIGEWIDSKGKKHKDADSPRYKALGNSIALPFWQWMADRMVKVLKEDGVKQPTMASLFDGIGGFPLVYSRCGCKPIWASEIEEFPMAVTRIRFPEEKNYAATEHI